MDSGQKATTADPQQSVTALPSETDVVIVGGGIIGVSTALFLAEKGLRVCVCEKGRVAAEQSSRNWGWTRQMGRDPAEMPLAIESLAIWRQLKQRFGIEVGYRETGITYLCRNAREEEKAHGWAEIGKAHNLPQRTLGAREIAAFLPGAAADFTFALHTSSDGRAEPSIAAPAIADAAAERGAIIATGCAARGIETTGGRISVVVTEKGPIRCMAVVVAGGAWSRLFLGNLGIAFPQLKVLSAAARIDDVPGMPNMPVGGGDFAFRRRLDGGFTVAPRNVNIAPIVPDSFRFLPEFLPTYLRTWRELRLRIGRQFFTELAMPRRWALDQPSPFERFRVLDPVPPKPLNQKALAALSRAFPAFANARITQSWAGMIDVTPDEIPVIDAVDGWPGLYLASGFSGHGFGIGPGAGMLMLQLVTGDTPCVDPSPFRFSRFASRSTPCR